MGNPMCNLKDQPHLGMEQSLILPNHRLSVHHQLFMKKIVNSKNKIQHQGVNPSV
jgi:hypothetical protein